jgi:type I restriction enzyme, S subunit
MNVESVIDNGTMIAEELPANGTMDDERLLALYDRVAEAPAAIARLRRFVLDLAVRGRLVEQDPGDEPARLGYPGSVSNAPYAVPNVWHWMRIGEQLDRADSEFE